MADGRVRIRSTAAVIATVLALLLSACASGSHEARPVTVAPTLPDPTDLPEETFHLAVIGDFGVGDEREAVVAESLEVWVKQEPVDALVTVGDNIYPDRTFEQGWVQHYSWLDELGIEVIASLGNHDWVEGDAVQTMRDFGMPGAWYERDVGPVDIFILNSNEVDNPAQTKWLVRALKRSDAAWQFVVFHHPAYSCAKHDSTPEVIETWVPLMEKYGADLVLNGHDHVYERFQMTNGVTYVVTGGGGADLYELEDCGDDTPERLAADDELRHFVSIEGNANKITVAAIAPDGTVIDEFTIENADG